MIKLSNHAAEAMDLRNIDIRWIETAIASPDARRQDPKRLGVTLSFKAIQDCGGKILRVAHRQDGNDTKIITVYFDRGAKL